MMTDSAPKGVLRLIGDRHATSHASVKMVKDVMMTQGPALLVVVLAIGEVVATHNVNVGREQIVMMLLDIAQVVALMGVGEINVISIVNVMKGDYVIKKQVHVQMDVLLDILVLVVIIHVIASQVTVMTKLDIVLKDVHLDFFQTLFV